MSKFWAYFGCAFSLINVNSKFTTIKKEKNCPSQNSMFQNSSSGVQLAGEGERSLALF